jgi:hypothetical protein
MAKEVAKKKSTNVVEFDQELLLADSGAGLEGMTSEDFMIPRITILQQMSPAVNKRDGAYVEGAEPGHILDNVARETVDGEVGIIVVPVSYRRSHVEWKKDRGGFVRDHGSDPGILEGCSRGDRGEYLSFEGNEIVPTAEYYVFVVEEDGSFSPALLSMSKSQLKKARRWNSMISKLQVPHPTDETKKFSPAMFWNAYKLTTVPEENDQGSWFNWDIEMMFDANSGGIIQNLKTGRDIYLAARDFKDQVNKGEIKVSPDTEEDPDTM